MANPNFVHEGGSALADSLIAVNGTAYTKAAGTPIASTGGFDSSAPDLVQSVVPRDLTILASGARTTTQTGSDQINPGARGLLVVVDMTVVGTGSITMTIQGKDPASAKYYTILASAAVITNVTNLYRVYPTITASANAIAQDVLPATWRILVTANNANSATYSVGAVLLA